MGNSYSNIDLTEDVMSYDRFRQEVLQDYKIAMESRETSLLGRREVLTGKAKFGIFGDGKEVAQIAMAKFFRNGDFRAGYYRDQTFMFATGLANIEQFFAQLYADPDITHDPFSAGRQMNAHFATPFVDEDGNWLDLANRKNISSDIAPTAGQMPRALGLALASKALRSMPDIKELQRLSNRGNEICFCTIGDASTSEGHFWETLNAAGVMQVPLAVFVWDDGFGISVPKKFQTTKGSISEAMSGLQKTKFSNGINIYKVNGWDYAGMCEVFEAALAEMRETHVPALFHVEEITQPQGHSTSGSHERYKTHERLQWEKEWDCIKKFREWIIANGLASEDELSEIEADAKAHARESKIRAWANYIAPIKDQVEKTVRLLNGLKFENNDASALMKKRVIELQTNRDPLRRDIMKTLSTVLQIAPSAKEIKEYYKELKKENKLLYNTFLFNEGPKSALKVTEVKPSYNDDAPVVNGYEVLNKYFDLKFTDNPRLFAFGEDVGKIGDVNQGFSGLQEKHGANRIFDTGIRELSIIGQGIGMALRGLRPIAEIQYLDYLLYGLQPLSDDLSTIHYRTKGRQSCPLIVRTRGHRLEGIWHSGSPMGMIINALRGIYVCVPRNMVQAAGMYNTLLKANDPAIMIEVLNGYRLKEKLPNNLVEFIVPLGIPQVLQQGEDVTIVSYGSTLRIVHDAATTLQNLNISCEIIDVQTLLPFDVNHSIVESVKKTNRIVFIDEDGPGGSTAFMFNEVIEKQGGYRFLDVAARTITAKPHRPSYGSDGDYFSKPNEQDIVEIIQEMMAE
ncbi:MAG TPA: thiamine pyrophosphate-dependent enzyme [Segetibacter sp.]|nr:thiamine pyrophosphate-dependent enzyme [Segetibacter sp.]